MPHFYNPGKTCIDKKVAKGCYRVNESAGSNSTGAFTINTNIEAEGSVFNSGTRRVEFIASVADIEPTSRATFTMFRVNGKTIGSNSQRKYGADYAESAYTKPFIKEIGRGYHTVWLLFIPVTVGAGIDAYVRPNMLATAVNPNPLNKADGWVRVIHQDSIKLSVGVDAGLGKKGYLYGGLRGELNIVDLNTGLGTDGMGNAKYTNMYLKRTYEGTQYYNSTLINNCMLSGKLSVKADLSPLFKPTKDIFG